MSNPRRGRLPTQQLLKIRDRIVQVNETLQLIRDAASPSGLNLVAVTPASRYDAAAKPEVRTGAIADGYRSIVIVGNGGGVFWHAYKRHVAANPGWDRREHPLDDFTRAAVEEEIAPALIRAKVAHAIVYPFMQGGRTLNFMEAAKVAGLAGPSIVGVMVHPVYGPWIAFRAAILLKQEIDAPGDALGFAPCPSCTARTCISACPVNAVSYPAGWDIPKCLAHRVEVEADCIAQCHARAACVLGPEHRYPDEELAYHQMRALKSMRPYYEETIKPLRKART